MLYYTVTGKLTIDLPLVDIMPPVLKGHTVTGKLTLDLPLVEIMPHVLKVKY